MHLRIGGVPEHFNLPWRLAIEEGAFHQLGIDLEWVDVPAGTGAIMSALAEGDIDLATPLTEGAITAIANGNPTRLVRTWVDSPLLWGIHVAAGSVATTVDDLEGLRFAISRFGSGSELMSLVLADRRGWTLDDNSWVLVETLEGALQALPAGDAEIFLWNMSMTQPHVDDGTLRRVDVLPTPWPSFAVAATTRLLDEDPALIDIVAETAIHRARALSMDSSANLLIADRYALRIPVVDAWLAETDWGLPGEPIDPTMIEDVGARMYALGRIDHHPTAAAILR